jgi:hypothetical protein
MSQIKEDNLDISMYSFQEILELFDLSYDISLEDMKIAKKKVLMLHPDKSKLSSNYFLFYKKAFDIVFNYYQNNNKQNQEVSKENSEYSVPQNDLNKHNTNNIKTTIGQMDPKEFQKKFNESFEKNMSKKTNPVNEWFSKDEPVYNIQESVSKNNMGIVLENIKKQNNGLVKYNGVQNMYSSGGTNLYYDEEETDNYLTSDPFSKLKFDDLRKVHKDQTIFAVSESDYKNVTQYRSVDEMNKARNQQNLKPVLKTHAEQMLIEQERILKEKMAEKQHKSLLKTNEYADKNKIIISSFLQLKN